jgi:hypothetical protein
MPLTLRLPPVRFPEMLSMVERSLHISEGQCLWAIRQFLRNEVPMFMMRCLSIWNWLTVIPYKNDDQHCRMKKRLACVIIAALRRVEQYPDDQFIGALPVIYDKSLWSRLPIYNDCLAPFPRTSVNKIPLTRPCW